MLQNVSGRLHQTDSLVKSDSATNVEFLAGGGSMGERIHAHPWAHTPLGRVKGSESVISA